MLTAEQMDSLVENSNLQILISQVELDIIQDMARRIKKADMTVTAQWQLQKATMMGSQKKFIVENLAKISGKSESYIFELINDTATTALNKDDELYKKKGFSSTALKENKGLQSLLKASLLNTKNSMNNFTNQTATNSLSQFSRLLDKAYMQVMSGAFTYDTAIKNAVSSLAQEGIHSIKYPSGRVDNMDVASRRAILTSINQTSSKVSLQRAGQLGSNLVEVSAHMGCRETHLDFQGKVFMLVGSSTKYANFYEATGYGTGGGLCGVNCRHNFYPFFEDSKPSYSNNEIRAMNNATVTYQGKDIAQDKALQIQRNLERTVRKWKRVQSANEGAGLDNAQAKMKVSLYQKALRDFTSETGLKRDYTRERVID